MTGIYIHIPFCLKKCRYCDFYSISDLSAENDFVEALVKEIQFAGDQTTVIADTIYFGGGTPSSIHSNNIERILDEVNKHYHISKEAEITIEVNPGTVSSKKLNQYKKMGINRLNIGVQSFNDKTLQFLGRIHSSKEAQNCIEQANNAGFTNIGIDIIHGVPGQTLEASRQDLQTAVSFKPDHLSCYSLTFEKGTDLFNLYEKGLITPVNDNLGADFFQHTIEYLEECGYIHYEISNFSSSLQTRSRHNMRYWNMEPYKGVIRF